MTYQPERDGYGVASNGYPTTEDSPPVVVNDDGTTSTVESVRPVEQTAPPVVDPGAPTTVDGRHTRVVGAEGAPVVAEGAPVVVDNDPAVVPGRRIDTVATPMAPAAVVARERAQYGGIKWGSAFFGWLSAMGLAVILTALVAAAGTALGIANNVTTTTDAANVAAGNGATIGTVGAIAVLLIMLVSYFAGGYVAGRMARFDGARQGFAVWLWAVFIAILVAIAATWIGGQYDVLGRLNMFPRVPVDLTAVTTAGLIALAVAALVSLVGAILGGLAGMAYHRKVDAAAFEPTIVDPAL